MKKFLAINNMHHVLRAHQLCMEGFSVLYDDRLSTVWSAPNYCYRCGNMASILEVGPDGQKHFNVFDQSPDNSHDGPAQQQAAAGQPQQIEYVRNVLIFGCCRLTDVARPVPLIASSMKQCREVSSRWRLC